MTPAPPQRRVVTLEREQLVVTAQLDDTSLPHHAHAVRVVSRVQAVRDGDHGATLEDRGERPLKMAGGPRVEQGSGFVKYQGVGIGQDQTGERDLLGVRGAQGVAGGP